MNVFEKESVFNELHHQLLVQFGDQLLASITPSSIREKLPLLEISVKLSDDCYPLRSMSHTIGYNRIINIYEKGARL